MAIRFRCQQCETVLQVPDAAAGKAMRCKNCGERNRIPAGKSQRARKPRKKVPARAAADDESDFLTGVDLTAEDRRFRVCQKCRKQFSTAVDEEETDLDVCPYCGYDHATGEYTVRARRKRLKKKGQLDPSEFFEKGRSEPLAFLKKHWTLALRSGLYVLIPTVLGCLSLFMTLWVSMGPPKAFWGFVTAVCLLVPPGWLACLDKLAIRATLESKPKLKRVTFDFFESAAAGIGLIAVQMAYVIPATTLGIGALMVFQQGNTTAGLIVAVIGPALTLPLTPVYMAHQAMPVSSAAFILHQACAIFARVAGAAFYWLGFALLTMLPAIVGVVIIGTAFGSDIATFVADTRHNSHVGYLEEMQSRGLMEENADIPEKRELDFGPLIAPSIILALSAFYVGAVALYPARMNGWLAMYYRKPLALIEAEKETKYVPGERVYDDDGNLVIKRRVEWKPIAILGGMALGYPIIVTPILLLAFGEGGAPSFGGFFFWIGWIVSLGAGLWFLAVAFDESTTWGLLVLFIPGAALVFLVLHWRDALAPFLLNLFALAIQLHGHMLGYYPPWVDMEAIEARIEREADHVSEIAVFGPLTPDDDDRMAAGVAQSCALARSLSGDDRRLADPVAKSAG